MLLLLSPIYDPSSGVSCGDLGYDPVAVIHVTGGILFQDNITHKCNTGYELVGGDVMRRCQADKTWSGTPINCTSGYTT